MSLFSACREPGYYARGFLSNGRRSVGRRRSRPWRVETLEPRQLLAGDILISELMAINDTVLADEDGEFSDWFELFNRSDTTVDLDGWYLTDNPGNLSKWRVPAVQLDPGQFLVVFASDKDRADPAAELHTNFKLSGGGEYLAVVEPDASTVSHAYEAAFPQQFADMSYGLVQQVTTQSLVGDSDSVAAIVPDLAFDTAYGMSWTGGSEPFDDSAWTTGPQGLGFGSATALVDEIGTDIGPQMEGVNSSAYVRIPFTAADVSELDELELDAKYNDGFVAYLNGQEVARRFAGDPLSWNSSADLSATQPAPPADPAPPLPPPPDDGELVDDFDPPAGGVTSQADGAAPAPAVQTGGPTGDFLRLIYDGQDGQSNQYTYDQTAPGQYSTITAEFDFRASSVGEAAADGFSIMLLPTNTYGATGAGPAFTAEEPNLAGAVAVGFDMHPAGTVNDVSIHFDGQELANARPNNSVIDLDANQFHHVKVELQQVGNGANVTVTVTRDAYGTPGTPTVVAQHALPMFVPYDNRVMFRGRTGGLNVGVDIDNVDVQYSNAYVAPEAISPQGLQQDFDHLGATPFTAVEHVMTDTTHVRPGPELRDDGPSGAYLRLIHDGVNTNRNSIVFDQAPGSESTDEIQRIAFDFRMTSAGFAADGMSMMLLPTDTYGTSGPGVDKGDIEKPDFAGLFGLGFRLHPEDQGVNDVAIHWDGAEVGVARMAPGTFDLNAGVFHRAELTLVPSGEGTVVTLALTPDIYGTPGVTTTPISNVLVEDMELYEYRVQFGARTGGRYVSVDLDNVVSQVVPPELDQDFDGGGTEFVLHQLGSSPAPEVQPGGPTGNFVRLVNDEVASQNAALALAQPPNQIGLWQGMEWEFDFRVTDVTDPPRPADGMGVVLLPADNHGAAPTAVASSEEPNLPGAFGIGLDVYDNGAVDGNSNNHVSLHWNNALVENFPLDSATQIQLASGQFHHTLVRIEQATGGARVWVTLTPDVHGVPGAQVEVVSDYFIEGMNPYDLRTEFVARTGGANASADLDNLVGRRLTSPQPLSTQQGFEGEGTDFQSRRFSTSPGPAILNDGPTGNYLRLIHDGVNDNRNSIAFDQTQQGAAPGSRISAGFDFRATSVAAAADGFAMMLIPSETYGVSGPGAFDGDPFNAEEPNYAGVFAVGFDLHPAATVNDVSVHWDGVELVNSTLPVSAIDLDNGAFHGVHVELVEVEGNVEATVSLVPDIHGTPGDPVVVANGVVLPGLAELYAYRVEFAGRTGGSNVSIDLDNVVIQTPDLLAETISLTEHLDALNEGQNILAVHGLNLNASDPSFLIRVALNGLSIGIEEPFQPLYFLQPTPGAANELGFAAPAAAPVFSLPSGVYGESGGPLTVQLTSSSPTAEVFFTLDGSEPDEAATPYTGPISVDASVTIRARAYDAAAGFGASPAVAETYVVLAADVEAFDSDLPIVVLDTMNEAIPGTTSNVLASLATAVIDTDPTTGRAAVAGAADFVGRGGMRVRGSSSAGWPKQNFAFETQDAAGDDLNVALAGMPAESDWVLFASYLDRSLIREMFVHQLSNDIGQYSVRTRPVEVFLNTDGGKVAASDYFGVYILMEKIKRDDDRVDIQELLPSYDTEPLITGGYIVKKDRLDPGESGFPSTQAGALAFVDPKEEEITPEQAAWIANYFAEFEAALSGPQANDPDEGYAKYIDVDSWIDHHWLNELAYNIDAFRLSTFMYMDRGGKLVAGPIWDFDRSLGNSTQLGGTTPDGWYHEQIGGTNYPWWPQLFADPDFNQRYIDRWHELRQGQFSPGQLTAKVDAMAAELAEGQARNFQRWTTLNAIIGPSPLAFPTWQEHVDDLNQWITDRVAWIDTQFTAPAVLSHPGGNIEPGVELTISAPGGTIYFTVDGSDPRASGGAVSASADVFDGTPIVLNDNSRVIARAFDPTLGWSGPVDATFIVAPLPLMITELNYHPRQPEAGSLFNNDDFEFIEIQNIGDAPIDLTGVALTDGVYVQFGPGPLTAGPATVDTFDAPGTPSTSSTLGTGSAAALLDDGGNQVMRLVHGGVGGEDTQNRVAFDRTAPGQPDQIVAQFDFRAEDLAGSSLLVGDRTVHTFDAAGTNYTSSQFGSAPAPAVLSGGPTGDFLRLVNDNVESQVNRIAFDRTGDTPYDRVVADFDFRGASAVGASPADGFSLLLLPTATYGDSGPGIDGTVPAEEPNVAGAFAVGFDLYNAVDGVNDVSIHWNDAEIQNVTVNPALLDLDAGVFHHVHVELEHVAGGANVTVTITPDVYGAVGVPVTPIDGVFVAGLDAYQSRVEFAGRTGGSHMNVDLDNIDVRWLAGSTGTVGQGLSLVLLPTDMHGASGAGSDLADYDGRPALAGALAVDLEFVPGSTVHDLVVYADGVRRLQTPVSTDVVDLLSGQFHRLQVQFDQQDSGVQLSVDVLPETTGPAVTLVDSVLLAGVTLYETRVELAGRRETLDVQVDVDNVNVEFADHLENWLNPGEYATVVRDPLAFAERYPGAAYEGVYTGNLSNGGERLRLEDAIGVPVVDFAYNDGGTWPGRADGNGSTLELIDPAAVPPLDPERTEYLEDGSHWRNSSLFGGTPGAENLFIADDVIINEVLAHSDPPDVDTIELVNLTGDPVDIGGWYLSDSSNNLQKYRIPDGTTIAPFDYLTFDESQFNASGGLDDNDFALSSSRGDDVWLLQADPLTGQLLRFADHVDFGPSATGVTLGRWPDGQGRLFPMVAPTLPGENAGPLVGDLLIGEVQYHPDNPAPGSTITQEELEFVELYNNSGGTLDASYWRLADAVELTLPAGTVLGAGDVLVAVGFDPAVETVKAAEFRTHYGIDESVLLVGPFDGRLDNAGDDVHVRRPDGLPGDPDTPMVLVDRVRYDDLTPWPTEADGTGASLTRVQPGAFGDFASSWSAETPTPGNAMFALSGEVVDRYVFYNNSAFDGGDPAANEDDDDAIATDKSALMPGQPATFANYISFDKGINGVMIDVQAAAPLGNVDVGDFEFHVGNSPQTQSWDEGPEPASVSVRHGAGVEGVDRIVLTWNDGDISQTWLRVTVNAGIDTRLADGDVFYFGNAVGEAGNNPANALVTAADVITVRDNPRGPGNRADIITPFDINRDRLVDATDAVLARNNATGPFDALRLITPTPPSPLPAEAEGEHTLRAVRNDAIAPRQAVRRFTRTATRAEGLAGDHSERNPWLLPFVAEDRATRTSYRPKSPATNVDRHSRSPGRQSTETTPEHGFVGLGDALADLLSVDWR